MLVAGHGGERHAVIAHYGEELMVVQARSVIRQLELIGTVDNVVDKYIAKAKDPDDSFRLMGFGHRVYKVRPTSNHLKNLQKQLVSELAIDGLMAVAQRIEEIALSDVIGVILI